MSFQTAVALDVKNRKNIKLHRWMHIISFIMILWMVPNHGGIHYYLDLSFLKVEECFYVASESIFWEQENFLIISTTVYILPAELHEKNCWSKSFKDHHVTSFTCCFQTKMSSTIQLFLDISPKSSGLALVFQIVNANTFTVEFL